MTTINQDQNPKNELILVGQKYGATEDEVRELIISLDTTKQELVAFVEATKDLDETPRERLNALHELTSEHGPVSTVIALLKEGGSSAAARNALYLATDAKESLRGFKIIDADVMEKERQDVALLRQSEDLKSFSNALEKFLEMDKGQSVSENSDSLNPPKIISKKDFIGFVRDHSGQIDADLAMNLIDLGEAMLDETIKAGSSAFKDQVQLLISTTLTTLQYEYEQSFLETGNAVWSSQGVEMDVFTNFTQYFAIDSRDVGESQWNTFSRLMNAFEKSLDPSEEYKACLNLAMQEAVRVGRDMGSNNLNDVIRQMKRGFTDSFQLEIEPGLYGGSRSDEDPNDGW